MAFIPIPDTALVKFKYGTATGGWTATNGLYFRKPGFIDSDMYALLVHLASNFIASLVNAWVADVRMEELRAWDMRTVDGAWRYLADTTVGAVAGQAMTLADCMCVSFYGDKRGKWNQGRNYLAGLNETTCAVGAIGATEIDAAETAYQTLITDPPTGWVWVVASRYLNNAPRTTGVTAQVGSVMVRNTSYAFQRRRAKRA